MKRLLILMLALMLMVVGGETALSEYSLPEKMQKQLSIGSGLKGSFMIHEEGWDEEAPFLKALNNGTFDFRGLALADGTEALYYCYQTDDQEEQRNKTDLYIKDGTAYLASDFLPETVIAIPGVGNLADKAIAHPGHGNPPFYSALLRLVQALQGGKASDWEAAFSPYQQKTELWLSLFPVDTEYLSDESGRSMLQISYSIPFQAVQGFLADLIQDLVQDEAIRGLLEPILTAEQQNIYLNPNLIPYYREIAFGLVSEENLVLSRTSDIKTGEICSSSLRLPLSAGLFGYDALQIDQITGQSMVCSLVSDREMIRVSWPEPFQLTGNFDHTLTCLRVQTAQDGGTEIPSHALSVHLTGNVTTEDTPDEEGKTHETYDYVCAITQDEALCGEEFQGVKLDPFEPVELHFNFHFSSKNAQQSPTTLEVRMEGLQGKKSLRLSGTFKSAAPWILTPLPHESSTDITTVSAEQMDLWGKTIIRIAGEKIERTPEVILSDNQAATEEAAPSQEVPLSDTPATAEETAP